MLSCSELSVWWCKALDRILTGAAGWTGPRARRLQTELGCQGLRGRAAPEGPEAIGRKPGAGHHAFFIDGT